MADDMRTLYTSLRPPVPCSRAERRHSLVDLARGEIDAQALVERRVASAAKVPVCTQMFIAAQLEIV